MAEKRKDNKGRNLRTGEYQRKDLMYQYKYIGADQDVPAGDIGTGILELMESRSLYIVRTCRSYARKKNR